jgi:hypothetical protein
MEIGTDTLTKPVEHLCSKLGIFRLVETLHMYNTGACEDPSDRVIRTYIQYLNYRLLNWKEPESFYDKIVKSLIHAVLLESLNK